jgi:hypothetical protein
MAFCEREFGVGLRLVVLAAAVLRAVAQQATLLQKALDALDDALKYARHLPRRQVRQPVEDDVLSFFLVNAVENEDVKRRVQSQIRRRALDRDDGAALSAWNARLLPLLRVKA